MGRPGEVGLAMNAALLPIHAPDELPTGFNGSASECAPPMEGSLIHQVELVDGMSGELEGLSTTRQPWEPRCDRRDDDWEGGIRRTR
jgi:hypothetical protein